MSDKRKNQSKSGRPANERRSGKAATEKGDEEVGRGRQLILQGLQEKVSKIVVNEWKQRPEILCHPNIPNPLHCTNPRSIFGQSWWDKTRRLAYKSTNYHCMACGVHKLDALGRDWLEAHEVYDVYYLEGIAVYVETVPLCHYCHNFIHSGRMKALLDQGKMNHYKYAAIHKHGESVLRKHGLKKELWPFEFQVKWKDWRLIIDGKAYKPHFKSELEWMNAHESED